jgi:hypothetical protein
MGSMVWVGLPVAEPVQENQEDHRTSLEAGLAEDIELVVPAAEGDRVVAWLDNLARVEEDKVPVFGCSIAVEEHCMPQLFEVAAVASVQEAFSNCLGLTKV